MFGPAPGVVVQGDRDREKTVIEKRQDPLKIRRSLRKIIRKGYMEKTIIHHD